jgi:hypothetical protein
MFVSARMLLKSASTSMTEVTLATSFILAMTNDVLTLAVATLKHLNNHATDLPNITNNNTRETTTLFFTLRSAGTGCFAEQKSAPAAFQTRPVRPRR